MAFADTQVRKLKARLRPQHVRMREAEGQVLHYLEGWHVVAEANRIFGFDGWDRETITSTCVWTKQIGARYCAAYVARVRITVRAGEDRIIREGSGAGESNASSPGQAHERASKAAETDATKRALTTFGNCFGLSLYAGGVAQDQEGRGLLNGKAVERQVLVGNGGHMALPSAALPKGNGDGSAEALDGDGEKGSEAAKLGEPAPDNQQDQGASPLQARDETSSSGEPQPSPSAGAPDGRRNGEMVEVPEQSERVQIDKSVLAIAEPKRVRDLEHLKFVADQPCMICGRQPCEAHHLRYVQPRALGRKSSDAYAVPLCALHHRELHARGNERAWWSAKGRDPLPIADQLWRESSGRMSGRPKSGGAFG